MLSRFWLGVCLCLAGCWVTAGEIDGKWLNDTDTDTGPILDSLEILSFSPTMGSNGGGTEVEIETTMLGPDIEVLLDGRVSQVLDVTGNVIQITVPPLESEGWVDLEVRSGGQVAIEEDAFYLWPDGSGKIGALGVFNHYEIYGASGETTSQVSAELGFVEPTDFHTYQFWAPGLDQCVSGNSPDPTKYVSLDTGAEWVTLKSGVHSVTVPASGDSDWFEKLDLAEADYIRDAKFDLQAMTSENLTWPGVEVPGFVQTPAADLEVTNPLLGDILASVSRTVSLRWKAQTPGDFVLVRIERYDATTTLKEVVTCVLQDDGSHDISSSTFSGWNSLSGQAFILMGRAQASEATLPHNGSRSDVLGIRWVGAWVWQL